MAEKLNLNDYETVDRVPGLPEVLEATPKGGGEAVRFKENLLTTPMQRAERRGYNMAAKDLGHEIPEDSWPEEEDSDELDTQGYPKKAKWGSINDGEKDATVIGEYPDNTLLIELKEEVNGSLQHRVPTAEVVIVEEPADETEAPETSEESTDSPEVQTLRQEVTELRDMVASLQATIEDLRRELSEAKGADTDAVDAEIGEDNKELEFPIGSRVKAENKKGEMKDNWIVASKPEKNRKGEEEILLVNIEGRLHRVSPEDLRKWNSEGFAPPVIDEETPTPAGETTVESPEGDPEAPADKRKWGWLQRAKDTAKYTGPMAIMGAVGKFFKGERILGEDDPNWSEQEREKRRKRRMAIRTLGIAAVFGAGVLTGFLLDSDDKSKDVIYNEHTDINNHLSDIDSQLDGISDQLQEHDHSVEAQHDEHDGNMTDQHQELSTEHNDLDEDIQSSHGSGNGEGGTPGSGSDANEGNQQPGSTNENGGEDQNGAGGGQESNAGGGEQGESFKVEYGNGVSHEIQEYAAHNGVSISREDAFRIYEQLEQSQGSKILDLHGTSVDSYWYTDASSGPEVRIASPGAASWYPEAETQLRTALGLS